MCMCLCVWCVCVCMCVCVFVCVHTYIVCVVCYNNELHNSHSNATHTQNTLSSNVLYHRTHHMCIQKTYVAQPLLHLFQQNSYLKYSYASYSSLHAMQCILMLISHGLFIVLLSAYLPTSIIHGGNNNVIII